MAKILKIYFQHKKTGEIFEIYADINFGIRYDENFTGASEAYRVREFTSVSPDTGWHCLVVAYSYNSYYPADLFFIRGVKVVRGLIN